MRHSLLAVVCAVFAAVILTDCQSNTATSPPLQTQTILAPMMAPHGTWSTSLIGANFDDPIDAVVDTKGNVYVATLGGVKKVAPPFTGPTYGKITNVNHKFGQPTGVAVDSHDNLYVADYGGSYPKDAVYKIATNGKISTVGHGIYTPWGVAVDAKGNVYVADTGNSAVKEVTPVGTVLTIGSGFERPFAVAVDPKGNVYVADTNGSIKKVSPPFNGPTNGKIKTLVGSGASAYGVAVDKLGDVFFIGGPALKEITPKGKVSVIAPYAYYGISVDSKFNVYFRATYGGNQSITKLTPYPAARQ